MRSRPLTKLDATDGETGDVNVVIETPTSSLGDEGRKRFGRADS